MTKNIQQLISIASSKENENLSNNYLKNQLEEYKKLQLAKDNEISKLTDINTSKQNEIERYKKIIEAQKSGSREKEIEEQYKKEREKLAGKINDLELKIYKINDEKNNLSRDRKSVV